MNVHVLHYEFTCNRQDKVLEFHGNIRFESKTFFVQLVEELAAAAFELRK